MEVCVASGEHLELRIWRSGVQASLVALFTLYKEIYSTLSLFTQVYKWVLATYCWGVTL